MENPDHPRSTSFGRFPPHLQRRVGEREHQSMRIGVQCSTSTHRLKNTHVTEDSHHRHHFSTHAGRLHAYIFHIRWRRHRKWQESQRTADEHLDLRDLCAPFDLLCLRWHRVLFLQNRVKLFILLVARSFNHCVRFICCIHFKNLNTVHS